MASIIQYVLFVVVCGLTVGNGILEERHLADFQYHDIVSRNLEDTHSLTYTSRHLLEDDGIISKAPKPNPEGCKLAVGDWCGLFESQLPVAGRSPPRGSKECRNKCNGVGNCNYDLGICDCPAGWTGEDCTTPQKRPCTNRLRSSGPNPASHVYPNGTDINILEDGWLASRCGGVCDVDKGLCYCAGSKGRKLAPAGSPPGTPPIQSGKHMECSCQPGTDAKGTKVPWGQVPWEQLYGPKGWCEADQKYFGNGCSCVWDGWSGPSCNVPEESFCLNQCSGHGTCDMGFCKCYDGWYGMDCARKVAGATQEPTDLLARSPWLRQVARIAPASLEPHPRSHMSRKRRPLIYVYDVPPPYMTRMLQYRGLKGSCTWREWVQGNRSNMNPQNLYALETYFLEVLLQSSHRTFDPEEADFFFVPAATSCWMHPVFGWADYPWWHGPIYHRPLHMTNMLIELKRYLQKTHPYWNRNQGRDHIFMALHDEGACWFPKEVYDTAIMLTHWGRMDLKHESNTAFPPDNYSFPIINSEWQPIDWRESIKGHPCYDPKKDLVVPSFKSPDQYADSPFLGGPQKDRNIFVFFRGDVGQHRLAWYSRGLRQKLTKLSKEKNWDAKYGIKIGATGHIHGSYSNLLAHTEFCLVLPGDGWSARAEDCMVHGAIPVVIMDNVHAVYESILDWDAFSVRIAEKDVERLPEILSAISKETRKVMHERISRVWHRFIWAHSRLVRGSLRSVISRNAAGGRAGVPLQTRASTSYLFEEDAFHTIMSWLYARIPKSKR